MEALTLTAPISVTSYQIKKILFDLEHAIISIILFDSTNNQRVNAEYAGPTATTLMNQLNTVNLSTTSLHRRILERLVADGKLPAGTVTGTPD